MLREGYTMNYAVIDLGSNTLRLSVYRAECDGFGTVISQKEVVGLAGYVCNNKLEPEGIQRACEILQGFKEIAVRFAAEEDIYLFATASLRGLDNEQQACDLIEQACGLLPEVLSGEEEARLGFLGASHAVDCNDGILIDIGGASTELVLFREGRPVELVSLPLGCLSLYSGFVGKIIPTENERRAIKKEIRKQFDRGIQWDISEALPLMIGVGGTVRAAHKLSRDLFVLPEGCALRAGHIKRILHKLKHNEDEIFRTVYKRIPERTLTIFPGLMILNEAIKRFDCKRLAVSHYGVREGYFIDRVLQGSTD